MIQAKQVHTGQYKRYGDTFYVYEVTSDEPITEQEVIEWSKVNIREWRPADMPGHSEWARNVSYGSPKWNDPGYYFDGYYTIKKIDEKTYEVSICRPYCD